MKEESFKLVQLKSPEVMTAVSRWPPAVSVVYLGDKLFSATEINECCSSESLPS